MLASSQVAHQSRMISPVISTVPQALSAHLKLSSMEIASQILAIIGRYQLGHPQTSAQPLDGSFKFLAQIYAVVESGQPIKMCLPAFPAKSCNSRDKVLGYLPDKAEEFALAHLNGLCLAIEDIYSPGASLRIVSDGLVYNDLLNVPDKYVWAYGEALRSIACEKGFRHIHFSRLNDLIDTGLPSDIDINEIDYVTNATNFRLAMLNCYGKRDFKVDERIAAHQDTCLTYKGYMKFLEIDLRTAYPIGEGRSKTKYHKGMAQIAKKMLYRGDAFARAIRENFADHIRLSIHPSTNETKLSISLLPTKTRLTTPWHGTLAILLDGTITSGHRARFEADETFELIYEQGRPSYFREKSRLSFFSWGESKGGIICEPIYPSGVIIRPAAGRNKLEIADIDATKVRALAETNSPILLRGFARTGNKELFVSKAKEFGEPVEGKFGFVLEIKDTGTDSAASTTSAEWLPFHYDGIFKTTRSKTSETQHEVVSNPPRFQMFTAVTTSPKNTGFTLFSSSNLIFNYLPDSISLDYLRTLTWNVSTTATSVFDACELRGLPLVIDHPTTGRPCLRYQEPWPAHKTKFQAMHTTIEDANGPLEESAQARLCAVLDSLLYDRRVAYWHAWEKGDVVISDNTLMMHTRSDFTAGCDRELWRIHFD